MDMAASNKKINLNDKNHEDLVVVDCDDKDKPTDDFGSMAIISRKVGNFFEDSTTFELDNLPRIVDVNSYESLISLFISEDNSCRNIVKDIITDVAKKLPSSTSNIICIADFGTSTEENKKILKSKSIFAVFLASMNRIYKATLGNCDIHIKDIGIINKVGERFAEELGLFNCEYAESVLLLFGKNDTSYLLSNILKTIQTKVPENHQMNWIYMFCEHIEVANSHSSKSGDSPSIMALRITAPKITSWSESYFYKTSLEEFQCKLKELKKKVILKNHSFGLIFWPKCIFENRQETPYIPGAVFSNTPEVLQNYKCDHGGHPCCVPHNSIKILIEVFPNVPFTGIYHYSLLCNEKDNTSPKFKDVNIIFEEEYGLYAHKYGRIMIITYD